MGRLNSHSNRQERQQKLVNPAIQAIVPNVGGGNTVETLAASNWLNKNAVLSEARLINTPDIWLAQQAQTKISESTGMAMQYTARSAEMRSSFMAQAFQLGLLVHAQLALLRHPETKKWLTPQNMLAIQLSRVVYWREIFKQNNDPAMVFTLCPDPYGKHTFSSLETHPLQHESVHLIWNKDGYTYLHDELGLPAQLIHPIDPIHAFPQAPDQTKLPEQERLRNEAVCIISVSKSGGDAKLLNTIISALWNNSRVRSAVYAGNSRTEAKLEKNVASHYSVQSSIDQGKFYHQTHSIPNHTLLLLQPSEMAKYLAVLASLPKPVLPQVAWLPSRGEHELMSMLAVIDWHSGSGIIPTICLDVEYQQLVKDKLQAFKGLRAGVQYRFVTPQRLSAYDFQPTPPWKAPAQARDISEILSR